MPGLAAGESPAASPDSAPKEPTHPCAQLSEPRKGSSPMLQPSGGRTLWATAPWQWLQEPLADLYIYIYIYILITITIIIIIIIIIRIIIIIIVMITYIYIYIYIYVYTSYIYIYM